MDESQIQTNEMILKYQKEIKDLKEDSNIDVNTYRQLMSIYVTSLNFWEERKRNYLNMNCPGMNNYFVKDQEELVKGLSDG